jgi:dinuclear metal center YbgI/SA1388 family protein
VRDVANAVARAFPLAWAEPWDNVGLLAGDPAAPVTGVLVSLDPTLDAVERAVGLGANVLATHHPAFLTPPARLAMGTPTERLVASALASGVALIAAHTNLDRAPAGATALPALLGLDPGVPVERALQPVTLVSLYCPPETTDAVREAMFAAGAGRIGEYEECSFALTGMGAFRAPANAEPYVGESGQATTAEEIKLEVVCDPAARGAVVSAAREAHPYEEPLITLTAGEIARGHARMGRLCTLAAPVSLAALAATTARVFECTPRVWGDRERLLTQVATATGSAGGLLGDVMAVGAHVLVAGEVRYHDALNAVENGVCVIEVGHDVSEWPLVPVLGTAVRETPGLDPALVHVDRARRAWWTP